MQDQVGEQIGDVQRAVIWVMTAILAAFLIRGYYAGDVSVYVVLERAYSTGFWHDAIEDAELIEDECLRLTATVPRYVSSLADSELLLTIENLNTTSAGACARKVVTPTIVVADNTSARPDDDRRLTSLAMRSGDDAGNRVVSDGSSAVDFGPIPPKAVVTRIVWLRVLPSFGGANGGAGGAPQRVPFYFYMLNQAGAEMDNLYTGEVIAAEVNPNRTVLRAFIKTILLPPWSNGAILLSAFILANALAVAIDLVMPDKKPDKKADERVQHCVVYRKWYRIALAVVLFAAATWIAIGLLDVVTDLVVDYATEENLNSSDSFSRIAPTILWIVVWFVVGLALAHPQSCGIVGLVWAKLMPRERRPQAVANGPGAAEHEGTPPPSDTAQSPPDGQSGSTEGRPAENGPDGQPDAGTTAPYPPARPTLVETLRHYLEEASASEPYLTSASAVALCDKYGHLLDDMADELDDQLAQLLLALRQYCDEAARTESRWRQAEQLERQAAAEHKKDAQEALRVYKAAFDDLQTVDAAADPVLQTLQGKLAATALEKHVEASRRHTYFVRNAGSIEQLTRVIKEFRKIDHALVTFYVADEGRITAVMPAALALRPAAARLSAKWSEQVSDRLAQARAIRFSDPMAARRELDSIRALPGPQDPDLADTFPPNLLREIALLEDDLPLVLEPYQTATDELAQARLELKRDVLASYAHWHAASQAYQQLTFTPENQALYDQYREQVPLKIAEILQEAQAAIEQEQYLVARRTLGPLSRLLAKGAPIAVQFQGDYDALLENIQVA